MAVVLYHNPQCSKSRATLALLRERGVEPQIVDYLHNPPSRADILDIIEKLDAPAKDLLRHSEADLLDSGLGKGETGDEAIAEALAANPKLLQRPIVVAHGQARIGRPPEHVLAIL